MKLLAKLAAPVVDSLVEIVLEGASLVLQ